MQHRRLGTARTRAGLGVLAGLLASALVVGLGSTALARPAALAIPVAGDVRSATTPTAEATDPAPVDLHDDHVLVGHQATGARGFVPRRWPTNRITYHSSLPKKYAWSLSKAVRAWNRSGTGITFKRVPKSRAKLTISRGNIGSAGLATTGYTPGVNWAKIADFALDTWPERELVGQVIAHELGHVLGLMHTSRPQCGLMLPVLDWGCLEPIVEGRFGCRWIDRNSGSAAARLYRGAFRAGPARCLVLPLPPQLADASWTGGHDAGAPVRFRWSPPAKARPGTVVLIDATAAPACDFERGYVVSSRLPISAGGWREDDQTAGRVCYRSRVENSAGGPRPWFDALLPRWAPPPPPPELTSFRVAADGSPWAVRYRFGSALPTDSTMLARSGEACPTRYREQDYWSTVWEAPEGGWEWHLDEPTHTCVSFLVVNRWGNVSEPTTRPVAFPRPAVPSLTVTREVDEWGGTVYAFTGTVAADTSLRAVFAASNCPAVWSDTLYDDPGLEVASLYESWEVPRRFEHWPYVDSVSETAGCVSVFAIDDYTGIASEAQRLPLPAG